MYILLIAAHLIPIIYGYCYGPNCESNQGNPVVVIIASVVGGVAAFLILLCICVYCCCRHKSVRSGRVIYMPPPPVQGHDNMLTCVDVPNVSYTTAPNYPLPMANIAAANPYPPMIVPSHQTTVAVPAAYHHQFAPQPTQQPTQHTQLNYSPPPDYQEKWENFEEEPKH